jgi:UDP-N-acetylglucosamine--N-acetylmuramyl-(pentapeptide) pyrophosphoryl-undecaprenol N-acetylglucosamine transferase
VSELWPILAAEGPAVRITLQCGAAECDELTRTFNESGLDGEVVPFIHDMPQAYAEADLVVSRAGAGAVAELAAAARPSILVPFPHATDNHQYHNAAAMASAGAARLLDEAECDGARLHALISEFATRPELLARMSAAARALARPGAARRAAEILLATACQR